MKSLIAGLGLVLVSSLAWALPTVEQVEAQVGQGHYAQAETMMAEVVAAKPGSAKARYFYAEILAHNANFTKASEETAKARELDPKIGFADPAKFAAFEQTLQREQNPTIAPRARNERSTSSLAPAASGSSMSGSSMSGSAVQAAPETRPGLPGWIWLVGLLVLAFVAWKMFSRNGPRVAGNMASAGGPGMGGNAGFGSSGPNNVPGYGPANPGYGPGYGPGAAPVGRPGGGLLGTGLAVAGGVAGGMLLDEALRHRSEGGNGSNNNFGGFEPGNVQSSGADQAASDLENRQVDFGNGGDWDSGGSGDSGGGDSGGGDSGGGWD